MDIKFKELHIENFMSIGEATIDLSDRAFTLIEGVNNNEADNARSNGSGKSSIFESLVWSLTGSTMRGNKDIVNYNGSDGALVKLTFIVDGDKFVITRTKDHSKHKTNLFIEINGVDKSGKGIRQSELLLSEYLPDLTPSLIGSVIVLGQGLPQKFSSNSPSGRKEVLEKLFKSDYMIQDLKNRISNRRTELNEELRTVQDSRLVNNTKISTLEDRIKNDTDRLHQLDMMDDLDVRIDKAKKFIDEYESKLIPLKEVLTLQESQKGIVQEEIFSLKEKKLKIQSDIDIEYSPLLNELQQKIQDALVKVTQARVEFDRVKNIDDVCPTCGQKIPNVSKPDVSIYENEYIKAQKYHNELSNTLLEVRAEIDAKKISTTKVVDEEILLKQKEYNDVEETISSSKREINDLTKSITTAKREYDELYQLSNNRAFEIKQLEESIHTSQKTIDSLTENNRELDEQESVLNDRIAIQNKFNTAITRDFRGYLLNDIIVYINSKAKEYCKDVFGTDLIEFTLDGNNLLISYNNKEYEALSGGERQKVDLIIQFAIRDMLCKHTSFSSNIIVMDEIFDNLDDMGCQKIIDLITTKLYDISSIFIITHHGNELNVPYDNVISIEKDNNGVTRIV